MKNMAIWHFNILQPPVRGFQTRANMRKFRPGKQHPAVQDVQPSQLLLYSFWKSQMVDTSHAWLAYSHASMNCNHSPGTFGILTGLNCPSFQRRHDVCQVDITCANILNINCADRQIFWSWSFPNTFLVYQEKTVCHTAWFFPPWIRPKNEQLDQQLDRKVNTRQ